MDDRIHGTTMPVLEMTLQPGESIIAESGELSWMTSAITMKTNTQMAGGGGMFGVLKRGLGGGSLFMTEYSAQGGPGMVAFATRLPGQIFPIDVAPRPGQQFFAHRHGFMCATQGVTLSVSRQRLGAGVFGGEGFLRQSIGGEGRCWIELSGEVVTYDLRPGEVMRVHPGHVGLFQDTVQFNITTIPGIKNKIFGGDGLFLAEMVGPGRVWLQSLTIDRLAASLAPFFAGEAGAAGAAGGIGASLLRNMNRG